MSYKGYRLAAYHTFLNEKLSIDIILDKKVTRERLSHIAAKLYSEFIGIAYEKVFIYYYLSPLDIGLYTWATTHYTPTMSVIVLGK